MAAVRQYQPGGALETEQVEVPRPGPGEVLVRMGASPLNPSDLALLAGGYLERSYPFTPGLEGSGTVVLAGKGIFPRIRLGKRVACTPVHGRDGTWAEYMITRATSTAPLPRHISMEKGAMMLVNPMTAMAFIHMARQGRHRGMINNAAASSLGRMLIRLAKKQDIPLINIVRKEEQVEELKSMGATHVLNSSSESFSAALRELSSELNATLILDAVTGEETSLLLDAAPRGATLVAYARLSGDPIRIDPLSLMSQEKKATGFMLANWLEKKGLLFMIRFVNSVRRELDGSLSSHISRSYPLERVEEAITQYRGHMSEGKIILNIASE